MLVINKVFNPIKYGTYSFAVVLVGGIVSYSTLNLLNDPKQSNATESSQNSVTKTTPVQSSTPQPDSSSSFAAAAENYSAFTMLGTATSGTTGKPSNTAATGGQTQTSENDEPVATPTTPEEPTTTTPPVTTEPPVTEPVIPVDPPIIEPVDPPADPDPIID